MTAVVLRSVEHRVLFGTLFLHCLFQTPELQFNCILHTMLRDIFQLYFLSEKTSGNRLQYTASQKGSAVVENVDWCTARGTFLFLSPPKHRYSCMIFSLSNRYFLSYLCSLSEIGFVLPLPCVPHPSFNHISPLGFSVLCLVPPRELDANNYPFLHIIPSSVLLPLWVAPEVLRPLWPVILSGRPDSLLSPWWRMAEALPCLALNYYWG